MENRITSGALLCPPCCLIEYLLECFVDIDETNLLNNHLDTKHFCVEINSEIHFSSTFNLKIQLAKYSPVTKIEFINWRIENEIKLNSRGRVEKGKSLFMLQHILIHPYLLDAIISKDREREWSPLAGLCKYHISLPTLSCSNFDSSFIFMW